MDPFARPNRAVEILEYIMTTRTEPADLVLQKKTLFSLSEVRKDYQMGEVTVSALRGVTLDIEAGEFVVILGPSGSGKSTLLNIVGGLDAPSAGTVHFGERSLDAFSESERTRYRRNHIGFVFQFYNLMPNLTAKENVELATEISQDPMAAQEALELVTLGDRSTHFPGQLSGGEQQRVAIARAIAKRPEVLLCDEPTGALDISTGKIVLQALRDINEKLGTTLIVITHNATIGSLADRVFRMADGQIREVIQNRGRKKVDELDW
jgi:putative ABC transport system ATP-binding protein